MACQSEIERQNAEKLLLKRAQGYLDQVTALSGECNVDRLEEKIKELIKFTNGREFPKAKAKTFQDFASSVLRDACISECQKNFRAAMVAARDGDIETKAAQVSLLRKNTKTAIRAGGSPKLDEITEKLILTLSETTEPGIDKAAKSEAKNKVKLNTNAGYANNKRRATRVVNPPLNVTIDGVVAVAQSWSMYGMLVKPVQGSYVPGDTVVFSIRLDDPALLSSIQCDKRGKCGIVVDYQGDELRIQFPCQCTEILKAAAHIKKSCELERE